MLRIVIALVAVVLSNSVSAQIDKPPGELATTHGFFTARALPNSPRVGIYFSYFAELEILADDSKGKRYTFGAVEAAEPMLRPTRPSSVYGGWLPAGTYHVDAFRARYGALSTYSSVKGSLGAFEIKPGTVTDLGLLVVQPVGEGKAAVFPLADPKAATSILATNFPNALNVVGEWPFNAADLATGWKYETFEFGGASTGPGLVVATINGLIESNIRGKSQASWSTPQTLGDYLDLAMASTTYFSNGATTPDGTMYLSSSLGQLLRRTADGKWQHQSSGQLGAITAVALDGKTIVLGTESGELLRSTSDGETFAVIKSVPNPGVVLDVHRLSNGEWVVAYQRLLGEVLETSVYISSSLDEFSSSPAQRISETQKGDFWSGMVPRATVAGGRAVYFIQPGGKKPPLIYSASTRTWAPGHFKVRLPKIEFSGDRSVLFTVRPSLMSTDDGGTWQKFNAPSVLPTVAFFDSSNALGLILDSHAFSADQDIKATHDGGRTWAQVNHLTSAPCDGSSVRSNFVQKRIVCVFRDGSIHSSGTEGDWVLER